MALSQNRRDYARTVFAALLSFSIVWTLGLSGWLSAGNDSLFSLYHKFAPGRHSAHRVIVLSTDPEDGSSETTWNNERLTAALQSLMKGHPAVVALADPEQTFGLSKAQVSKLLSHPQWDHRIFAARSGTSSFGGAQGVTHVGSTPTGSLWNRKHVVEVVTRRIAQAPSAQGAVPVHYLKSRQALPKIPFSTLLSTQTQVGSFEGNILLIGATQEPQISQVNTPIGPMSPLEVHAHTLSGLVDGAVWDEPTSRTKQIALLTVLLGWCIFLRRRKRPGSLRLSLFFSLGLIAADWVFFARGLVMWGSCEILCGLWLAQFIIVRDALTNITNKVGYLQTRLAEMLPSAISVKQDEHHNLVDDAFWQDLVDFGRSYVKFDFEGMLAELPEKEWHIQIRASTGSSIQQIAEKRRDIRRAPFRGPFLTQKCGWAQNFIKDETFSKSLVVPMHHESKLYGYWLLHMRPDQEVDAELMRSCEGIARQMASVIAQKRSHQELDADEPVDRAQVAMDEVERDVARLEQERRWAIELVEQNSEAIMMASLWGPIEMMNQSMRARMELLFPNGIPDDDLRGVIAKLSGAGVEQVQTLMRSAVVDSQCVTIPRAPDEDETFVQGDYGYSLRTIEVGADAAAKTEVPNMSRVRFLLVAKHRYEVPQVIGGGVPLIADAEETEHAADHQKTKFFERAQEPAPEPESTQDAVPEPTSPNNEPELAANAPPEPLIYFVDGWEDWTPSAKLDPSEDQSVPSGPRAAGC